MGTHLLVFVGVAAIVILLLGSFDRGQAGHGRARRFLAGFLSDLANPKIGIRRIRADDRGLAGGLLPDRARAAETLRRPRVRSALDRGTGVVLIAIGLRLVTEHR